MKFETKRNLCLVIALALILTVISTVSYAYFTTTARIKNQEAELSTATLALRFADNDNGVKASLNFGETVTKKFLIENTGTADASLSIDWKNLVNTYQFGSLTYRLTFCETENGQYTEILPSSNVPVSTEPLTQTMANEISVPVGETYYYNLEITLNNLEDVNQNPDLKATLTTLFDVGQPLKYRYYTLEIDPNGGEVDDYTAPQEFLLKNNETKSVGTPERTGYTFDGWEVKGSSASLDENVFSMGISNAKLVAKWIPNEHTITIDTDGGTYAGNKTIAINYNDTASIKEPTKEGYTFTGWNVSAGTLQSDQFTLDVDQDVTLSATWKINNYKYIVYHNQMNLDGSTYTLVSADTDESEAAYNTTVNPPVKTYTGFTSPSVQPLTIRAETTYPPILNRIDYNYERNKYKLTINANGGSYSGATSIDMFYKANQILNTPTKTGYNFTKWTVTNGSTIQGNTVTIGASNSTATANYTPKEFAITFNPNGGSVSTSSKTVTYASTYGDLPTPSKSNYSFSGWYTELEGGTQITSTSTVNITGDQTLYAHWSYNVVPVVPEEICIDGVCHKV